MFSYLGDIESQSGAVGRDLGGGLLFGLPAKPVGGALRGDAEDASDLAKTFTGESQFVDLRVPALTVATATTRIIDAGGLAGATFVLLGA